MKKFIYTAILAAAFASAAPSGAPASEPGPVAIAKPTKGRATGVYQRKAMADLLSGEFASPDTLDLLVIRVAYSDLDFTSPPHDSTYFANELTHTWEYFRGASLGAFGLGWEMAAGVTTLAFEASYYGEDDMWDIRIAEMLMDAVAQNDDEIDFSRFDAVALIHAGPGQETDFAGDSRWQVWSGFIDPAEMEEILADTLGTPGVPTNDLVEGDTFYVDNVMVLPENSSQDGLTFGSLGIYAYQVAMRLGMIPMYDTTPSGFPDSQGIGAFGLMGYGLYNAAGFVPAFPCAFHRFLMGWTVPVEVETGGSIDLSDINTAVPGDISLVKIGITPTEYYLVANRAHDADFDGRFDFGDVNGDGIPANEDTLLGAEFDFFLTATTNPFHYEDVGGQQVKITDTGSGVMIWHVDETIIRNKLGIGRYPNDDPGVSGVDLEEADGVQDLDRPGGQHAFGSWGDSYRSGWYTDFGPATIPASDANTGTPTGLEITALSVPGHVMGIDVTFGEGLPRVTGEIDGTVMGLPPVLIDLDDDNEDELVQAADTGKIYIAWDGCAESWDGAFDLVVDIPGAVWSGSPVVASLDHSGPMEMVSGSSDGRIHAYSTDGTPYPIDDDSSPGSLEVGGGNVSMALALDLDTDPAHEPVFLVDDGDSCWIYIVGHEHAAGLAGSAGGFLAGNGVLGMFITTGRIVSHPVYGADGTDSDNVPIYSMIERPGGGLSVLQIKIRHDSPGISFTSWSIGGSYPDRDMMLPAAGDIDDNGCDDVVFALPGEGVLFFDAARYMQDGAVDLVTVDLACPSPPSLADIDGDGVLDTSVRDRTRLFVFSGLGTLLSGWPVVLEDHLVLLEPDTASAQPVAADLDRDGDFEAIFNVAGDIVALWADGTVVDGWPIRGEGDHSITPAFTWRPSDGLFGFQSGGSGGIAGPDQAGTEFYPGTSTVSRVSLSSGTITSGSWPMFRYNAAGISRQYPSEAVDTARPLADENSFICYPNPATGGLFKVRLSVAGPADITVRIFSLEGSEVFISNARHDWEGTVPFETSVPTQDLASGIYICHVSVTGGGGEWSSVRKVAIVK